MRKILALLLVLTPLPLLAQSFPKFQASVGGSPIQLRAGKGILAWAYCGALAGPAFLEIWDASSTPTPGSTAVNASLPWAANQALTPVLGDGIRFNNGLYVAITTTANGAVAGGPAPCSFGIK